jgi:hypothetical protein
LISKLIAKINCGEAMETIFSILRLITHINIGAIFGLTGWIGVQMISAGGLR